ncbi:MAG: DUF362 domain-containing protein [Bacteroidetes bacterium]|nr:DUF362 domain-containing protein [Bacteroidota bacterium]
MKASRDSSKLSRRRFFHLAGLGSMALMITLSFFRKSVAQDVTEKKKPSTNIKDALAFPRKDTSLPGKFPGKVVKVHHESCIAGNKIDQKAAAKMVEKALLQLTDMTTIAEAWRMFVSPGDVVALKVNPIGGKVLSTSLEITEAIISQLEQSGVPRQNIVIFDRREFELFDAGFTKERFPGIKLKGTELKDKDGSFYDQDGRLYSEQMIDKEWFYWADVEGEYDSETMPYMINGGKYSYFSKVVTQEVDKIINVPVLKNAGTSVTLCLKNLAYGCVTNTGRLHKDLWSDTLAEACAFPPIRDKVVLNIVDGIRGCHEGGPGADPQYISEFKTLLVGTDPVAVDRIGYEMILKKRIETGIQQKETQRGKEFMFMAENLNLGIANLDNIKVESLDLV